jgi:hypothetical protein
MFQKSLRRQRLRQDTSAWTSGGPAKGRSVAAFLGRWRALPLRGPPRGQRFFFSFRGISLISCFLKKFEKRTGEEKHADTRSQNFQFSLEHK